MKDFGIALRQKREAKGLTVRGLGQLIDRSPTYVNDFEIAKKAYPPDPEMVRRLADALDWPVAEQLMALGYLDRGDSLVGNPFEVTDPRWKIVEALRDNDPFVVWGCLAMVEGAEQRDSEEMRKFRAAIRDPGVNARAERIIEYSRSQDGDTKSND